MCTSRACTLFDLPPKVQGKEGQHAYVSRDVHPGIQKDVRDANRLIVSQSRNTPPPRCHQHRHNTVAAAYRASWYQVIKLIMKPSILSCECLAWVYCAGRLPSPDWSSFSGLTPLGIQANQSWIWEGFNHFCLKKAPQIVRRGAVWHPASQTVLSICELFISGGEWKCLEPRYIQYAAEVQAKWIHDV